MVSSAVVVKKAQAWCMSPVDRAARHPTFSGSRRRCTRRSRSCSSRGAGTTSLGRTNLTTRCDGPPQVEVKAYRGVPWDSPTWQPLCCMEQRRQPRVSQQSVNARWSDARRAAVGAEGVPPQDGRQLKVRIYQPASQEGCQDGRRCLQRAMKVKVEVLRHKLRGRPLPCHVLCGVAPETLVKGWLGRDAVCDLGPSPDCLTTALQELGRKLTCRHA